MRLGVPSSARIRCRRGSRFVTRTRSQVIVAASSAALRTPTFASSSSGPWNARSAMRIETVKPIPAIVPAPATDATLTRVHTAEYVRRIQDGRVAAAEARRIGFPWSPEMVERSRRSAGGTVAACRAALEDGVAVNLAGGTHHAFPDRGEGFCVFNDTAVATRAMQAEGRARRILIIDCDVHQGNGTAAIFADDDTVFTFDIYAAKNFPFEKQPADVAIPLADRTGDTCYLDYLEMGLERAVTGARADLAIYVSGADPYAGDRLGRLALSKEGLADRDRLVFATCRRAGLPVAVTMAGGYGRDVSDTVDIHCRTVQLAAGLDPFPPTGVR